MTAKVRPAGGQSAGQKPIRQGAGRQTDSSGSWRQAGEPRPLGRDTLELIRQGGPDGSRVAWHVALDLYNAGHRYAEYVAVMTDPTNGCSRWYRDLRDGRPRTEGKHRKTPRGHEGAVRELERCWVKVARRPARRPDLADVHERCEVAMRYAAAKLSGRTRATRLKVLAAICGLAREHRTMRVLCPARVVAVAANVTLKTAVAAVHDLAELKILRYRGRASEGGSVYEVCAPGVQTPHTVGRGKSVPLPHSPGLDVFHGSDLGAVALLIYTVLDDEPRPRRELADLAGVHRTTVARRLPDLAERDLAVQPYPDQWIRGPADPAKASRFPDRDRPSVRAANRFADERAQRRRATFTVADSSGADTQSRSKAVAS